MPKRSLFPENARLPRLPRRASFGIPEQAIARWNAALAAKDEGGEEEATISIYDPIGMDWWTGEGVTAKRIAGILRNLEGRDVTVNINSPGGDLFEGIAIYNLFRDYPGKVTTRVIGLAASAASLIAMAGDRIEVARASFMMIHNVWVIAIGNRNDLREAADQLETFDDALADVYAARTGKDKKECAKLMDKETWFSGAQAIEQGFADDYMPADQVEESQGERALAVARAMQRRFGRPAPEPALKGTIPAGFETRNFSIADVRVEQRDDGGFRIHGHGAVFGQWSENLGGFKERINRGAFAKALKVDDVRALFNHHENFVLGRNRAGTLTLEEDEQGLKFTVEAPATTWAKDLAVSMERGDIDQASFAFQVHREGEEWEKGADGLWLRTINEVSRLWDVSVVTYAAYPQTDAAVRSLRAAQEAAELPVPPAPSAEDQRLNEQSAELDARRKAQAARLAEIDLT